MVSERVTYSDSNQTAKLKAALQYAAIPFSTGSSSDGREYIEWKGQYSDRVRDIRASIVGESFAGGNSRGFGDPGNQQRFKEALDRAGVPFETYLGEGSREQVRWKHKYDAVALSVWSDVRGPVAPDGSSSISFDIQTQARFKRWLAENKIPHKMLVVENREYVIWDDRDYHRISRWQDFPRDTYDRIRRMSASPS